METIPISPAETESGWMQIREMTRHRLIGPFISSRRPTPLYAGLGRQPLGRLSHLRHAGGCGIYPTYVGNASATRCY